jgi:glucan phosphoethanolaminetransferase (alkaline phosphatase superfamily)
MDNRPGGVTVLGFIAILGGFLHLIPNTLLLLGGVLGMFSGMFTTTGEAGAPASTAGLILTGLSLIGVLAALVAIIAGFGLLALRSWSWSLALIAIVVVMIGAVVRLTVAQSLGQQAGSMMRVLEPFGQHFTVVTEGAALVLCGVALVYLCTPTVREAFE